MRPIRLRQFLTAVVRRLSHTSRRRVRVRSGKPESLEPRVLLTANLVKDIKSGLAPSDPSSLANISGTLYFSANDGTNGYELWRSDGTSSGTVLVRDIGSPSRFLGSQPNWLTNLNGTLFFSAYSGTSRQELWKSDGSSSGTVLVKDFTPGLANVLRYLTNVNGTLYFSAENGTTGYELWKSDGTSSGTVLVRDIAPNSRPFGSQPNSLTNVNGTLFFTAHDGTNGLQLWKSDGTSSGTVLVRKITLDSLLYPLGPSRLTNLNGTLYFRANDGTNGYELWKSDGTSSGTLPVRDLNSSGSSLPSYLTNVNGTLYFAATDGENGRELWKSDGTSSGTVLVRNINSNSSSNPNGLTNVNGTLYFAADDGTSGTQLWKSDGTSLGTSLVRKIGSGSHSNPNSLMNFNGTLYFTADDFAKGRELYKSDGTSTGTVMVRDIRPGNATSSSYPGGLTNVNGILFFFADDGTNGRELWSVDPFFNTPPTNIVLSASSIAENQSSVAGIGNFSTTDPDAGNTFTYSLVSGVGATDNASFTIGGPNGNSLLTAASFDFETKSSYSIRVRSTDQGGLFFEKQFTITVTNINESPTDIALSATSIAENQASGTSLGSFATTDPDSGNIFNYTLVSGVGATDNASFTIDGTSGNILRTSGVFDFETKNSYSIRVRATDQGNLSFEKQFAITVTNVNEAPSDIQLSATSIAENQASGTGIGSFTTTDSDPGNTFTYTLVTGTCSTDNASFTIGVTSGNILRTNGVFDFEITNSYSIRVRATDQGNLSFEKQFIITVTNVNESPTDIQLSATSIAENQPSGTSVGNFSTVDPDTGNTVTYSLVSGDGSVDNASFRIGSGSNSLLTDASFDMETKSSYSIRVRSTDQGGLSFERQFTITVTDVNETPTDVGLSATSMVENQPTGTAIGNFATTDPDAGNTFTYTLVSGIGDTGNSSFQIDGGTLKTNGSLDFETQNNYSIRVRSTDQGGAFIEKQFIITVINGNDVPTAITLANAITELLANASTGSAIPLGDVAITDDGLGTNTVTIAGPDASHFEIVDGKLRLKAGTLLNYETKKTYSISVNTDDATLGGDPDASVEYTLTLQALQGLVVQNSSAGRSYVRFVTLNFETPLALASTVASLGTAFPRIRLLYGGAGGKVWTSRTLTSAMVTQVGNQLRFDFGAAGIGGTANASTNDGLYRLRVDLDGDGASENIGDFFRLFGDLDGNGIVNKMDISLVAAAQGTTGENLATDTDGDGDVDAIDLDNVKKRQGARVFQ